jgi:peptidoglycan/xylan/chitin deacetylase (PgdA/CDA1 family)
MNRRRPSTHGEPWWLRNGIVEPRHLLARARGCLPRAARVEHRRADGSIALTFDDGPAPPATAAVLDVLARHNATATFFVLTDHAAAHTDVVRTAAEQGHAIGLHGDRHESLAHLREAECRDRIAPARDRLAELTGRPVALYRPPFGRVSTPLLRAAAALGLRVVLWSHDPRDWDTASPRPLADRIERCLHPGAIVLLHDGTDGEPAEAIAPALDDALGRRAAVVPLRAVLP